jgi:molybdate transport system ATP-binding protein
MVVLAADRLTVRQNGKTILNQISFNIKQGEQWAITGPSGSGKTTFLKALTGKQFFSGHLTIKDNNLFPKKVVLIEQQHYFKNLSNTSNFYYQQRFNSQDAEDAVTVEEYLQYVISKNVKANNELAWLAELFDLKKLYPERLIQLSNGENKRLQIVKALLEQPAFLLLDNPFTGLDVKSRQTLEEVLYTVAQKGIHIIMVTSAAQLPFFITNVLSLSDNGSCSVAEVKAASRHEVNLKAGTISSLNKDLLHELTVNGKRDFFKFAVRMKNVTVKYDHTILDNITWEVRSGERWSLSGPNGSGKSTLLSLVNADNPQAYANDIYLFGRKRGTGESIWDIKKKTGFVSPELHLYFKKSTNGFDVAASGLFDTIGLFRKINEQQKLLVTKCLLKNK